jgi:hypothetical protein
MIEARGSRTHVHFVKYFQTIYSTDIDGTTTVGQEKNLLLVMFVSGGAVLNPRMSES